jgi:hypothetical protein
MIRCSIYFVATLQCVVELPAAPRVGDIIKTGRCGVFRVCDVVFQESSEPHVRLHCAPSLDPLEMERLRIESES